MDRLVTFGSCREKGKKGKWEKEIQERKGGRETPSSRRKERKKKEERRKSNTLSERRTEKEMCARLPLVLHSFAWRKKGLERRGKSSASASFTRKSKRNSPDSPPAMHSFHPRSLAQKKKEREGIKPHIPAVSQKIRICFPRHVPPKRIHSAAKVPRFDSEYEGRAARRTGGKEEVRRTA